MPKLQGADLSYAELRGADLESAKLQGADLSSAKFHGALLRFTELQGADLSNIELDGADLRGAYLQGADLKRAHLQGADLLGANVWLVNFPDNVDVETPAPLGFDDLLLSPLTVDEKVELRKELRANITDDQLLKKLLDRLEPIMRDYPEKWEDESKWSQYVPKGPSTS